MNIKEIEKYVILIFFMFSLLFSPKIGGILDVGLVISILIIVFYVIKNKKIIFSSSYSKSILFLFFIILYSLFIMLLNNTVDYIFLGRIFRSIISLIGIWIVLINNRFSKEKIIYSLIVVLTIHAVIVLFSSLINPELQNDLRWISGFNKTARLYRSTGLLTGFDISGFICNIGFLISSTIDLDSKKNILRIHSIIFIIATLFTSRFSIIVLILLIFFVYFKIFFKKNKLFEKIVYLFFIVFVFVVGGYVFISSTNIAPQLVYIINFKIPNLSKFMNEILSAYSMSDFNEVARVQYDFSNLSVIQKFFGTGKQINFDPGYIRNIYTVGFLGTIMNIFWYCFLLVKICSFNSKKKIDKTIKFVISIVILLVFALNFKNNYFFSSTVFEITVILTVVLYKKSGKVSEYNG